MQWLKATYPSEAAKGPIPVMVLLLLPLRINLSRTTRLAFVVLFSAVVFVLLIACSNAANLLIARGAAREREIAVRAALGATRSRIVRQLFTQSVLLAFVSACLGLLFVPFGIRSLIALAPAAIPRLQEAALDRGVLVFTLGVSFIAAVQCKTCWTNLRYAVRQFRLSPVFTAAAVLTLPLGIGGTTAIFTLIHAVMLRSLPVSDPGRPYRVGEGDECCVEGGLQDRWGDIWIPLQQEPLIEGDKAILHQSADAWLCMMGRLQPGASIVGMAPRLTQVLRQWIEHDAGSRELDAGR